jgi:hypothetical protein
MASTCGYRIWVWVESRCSLGQLSVVSSFSRNDAERMPKSTPPPGGCLGTAIFGSHIRSEQYSALGICRDPCQFQITAIDDTMPAVLPRYFEKEVFDIEYSLQ